MNHGADGNGTVTGAVRYLMADDPSRMMNHAMMLEKKRAADKHHAVNPVPWMVKRWYQPVLEIRCVPGTGMSAHRMAQRPMFLPIHSAQILSGQNRV
jgi:hypothetical protein